MIKKQQIVLLVLIAILILGSVVYGGYYLWQAKNKRVACTMEAKLCPDGFAVGRSGPNCEFAACPVPKFEDLSSWQTYRDEKLGFEMKYPNSVSQIAGVNKDGINRDFGINSDKVLVWQNSQGEKCQIGINTLGWGPPFDWVRTKSIVNINNNEYERDVLKKDQNIVWVETAFKKDNYVFGISLKPPKNGVAECVSLYDQIISTFKFTDGTTVDWQTYKNEKYGFEIKYPQELVKKDQGGKIILSNSNNGQDSFFITVIDNPSGLTVREFLAKGEFDLSYIKDELKIQGYNALKIKPEGACPGETWKIAKDNLIISLGNCLSNTVMGNQILSTFKFTK